MPRRPTRNAAEAAARMIDRRLREQFSELMSEAPQIDKAFLSEVLTDYSSCGLGTRAPAIGIAGAFEVCMTNRLCVVVPEDDYKALLKRLEAFKNVTIMPKRDAA